MCLFGDADHGWYGFLARHLCALPTSIPRHHPTAQPSDSLAASRLHI